MSLDQFCEEMKSKFPSLSEKAEKEYLKFWGEIVPEFYSYTWFNALARVLNTEMNKGVQPEEFKLLFSTIAVSFLNGSEEVKKAIDVSFVENLFWNVSSKASELHWSYFPEVLKKLYLEFHGKNPF